MSEYKILRNEDRELLERSVNEHLGQGWMPSGTITVLEIEREDGQFQTRSYIQPMFRAN